MKHKSYMYRQGHGWIVGSWDARVDCYRVSGELSYWLARLAVGTDNCPHATDGKCQTQSHQH